LTRKAKRRPGRTTRQYGVAPLTCPEMGGIYLRHGGSFIPMRGQRYEAESLLQALIAEHPEVLAGDDEGEPSGLAPCQEGGGRCGLP
jgi:hypothetical protein